MFLCSRFRSRSRCLGYCSAARQRNMEEREGGMGNIKHLPSTMYHQHKHKNKTKPRVDCGLSGLWHVTWAPVAVGCVCVLYVGYLGFVVSANGNPQRRMGLDHDKDKRVLNPRQQQQHKHTHTHANTHTHTHTKHKAQSTKHKAQSTHTHKAQSTHKAHTKHTHTYT